MVMKSGEYVDMIQKGVKRCLRRQQRPFRFLLGECSFVTNKAKSKVVLVFNNALRNKAVWGREVYTHTFLTSALSRGECNQQSRPNF